MDFDRSYRDVEATEIRFPLETELLCDVLKQYEASELAQFMAVSDKLAKLNVERFRRWQWPYPAGEGRPAIYAFKGDVYAGFEAETLSADDVAYTQQAVRILSGFYGLLRPLDAIMAYRLEMGRKLVTKDGADLYEFWRDKLTALLNDDIKSGGFNALVNLSSAEYFKAIDTDRVEVPVVTPVFKDYKNGVYKIIGFNAKRARGLMTRFIVDNRLTEMEDLKAFDRGGYHFNNHLSGETELVFTRR